MAHPLWSADMNEWEEALRFIFSVMNDPSLPDDLRDRAALVLLPLMHDRIDPTDEGVATGGLLQ